MIEKLVELGVSNIIPTIFERSSSDLEYIKKRKDRFYNLAISAAKQSMRSHLPMIYDPESFKELMIRKNSKNLWLYGDLDSTSIIDYLNNIEFDKTLKNGQPFPGK